MNRLLFFLLPEAPVVAWAPNLLLAIPRIFCGLLLSLDFGASKFGMPWTDPEQGLGLFEVAAWFPEDVANFGPPFSLAPVAFAWLGAASEAIGGLFLTLGLGTRFWALLIALTMLTAVFFQKWGEILEQGVWPALPAIGFLWVAVYSLALGGGKFSLDQLLRSKYIT